MHDILYVSADCQFFPVTQSVNKETPGTYNFSKVKLSCNSMHRMPNNET